MPAERGSWVAWGAAAAAAVLIAFAGCANGGPSTPGPGPESGYSIVVLPFDNLTADPAQNYFVKGIHEALITDLARTGSLFVISRASSERYADTTLSATQIAAELEVERLVEGAVSRGNGQVTLTVELIDGATGERLLEQSYERGEDDTLALLDEVAQAIEDEVRGTARSKKVLAAAGPVSPEAADAYFRGRFHFNAGGPPELKTALPLFQRAVAIDPSFARGWSGLAECYMMLGFFGAEPFSTTVPEARAAATRALELDGRDGVARMVLGYLALFFDRDWAAAKRELELALELSSTEPFVHHAYADYLGLAGDVEASLDQVKLGRRHDPFGYWANQVVIGHLFMARRYDETVEAGTRLLDLFPERAGIRSYIAVSLWQLGRYDDALEQYREGWGLGAQFVQTLTHAYREGGPHAAMRARADELVARSKMRPVDALVVARYYAFADEVDSSFTWLERALEDRDPQLVHMPIDPRFDSIRSDPRYDEMLRQMELPIE